MFKFSRVEVVLLAFGLFLLLRGVVLSHNGVHHFKNSLGGHVFDERDITNPMYLTTETIGALGTNGMVEFTVKVRTNYYWHPWRLWGYPR